MDKFRSILFGFLAGTIIALILVVVPVFGVRKSLEHLAMNWQEASLYASSIFTGGFCGALIIRCKQRLEGDRRAHNVVVVAVEKEDEPEFAPPNKSKWRILAQPRTKLVLFASYLLLYVNLCVLCQKLRLGLIDIPQINTIIRSLGACVAMLGLYIVIRKLRFAKSIPYFVESSYYDADIGMIEESKDSTSAHIPPVRLDFFARHPVCLGWTVYMAGMPLVFQAWFPLVALPGIYVVFNWVFGSRK